MTLTPPDMPPPQILAAYRAAGCVNDDVAAELSVAGITPEQAARVLYIGGGRATLAALISRGELSIDAALERLGADYEEHSGAEPTEGL